MTSIAVFGAGAIGCWVGGVLASAGADVTLVGRARVLDELANGLRVTDLSGRDATAHPALATDPAVVATADVVLVTVKSAATAEAGAALRDARGAIVSLQNGVRNAGVLRDVLPARWIDDSGVVPRKRVLAGMVPFNVVRRGPGWYHRASAGAIVVEPGARSLPAACHAAGLPFVERADMEAVQWAKLLMNLNNAINALSGLPLAEELGQRAFRLCLAACQREALAILADARVELARLTLVPPRWMPRLLALPDGVFRRLAGKVVAIDPAARSSMWDDFEAGRATEIDYLQGEVVALGERVRRPAPVNRAIVELVRAAEAGGKRDFRGDELYAAVVE